MLNGKDTIVPLIVGLVRKTYYKSTNIFEMSEDFPKPKSLEANVKVELDFFNYATKTEFKNATGVDTASFTKKTDLANSKSDVYKLDTDKLETVPANLSNLKSKVDKVDVDKLVPVLVDLSKLSDVVKNDVVKKDVYNAKIKNIDAKINEVKGEILSITNLATTASLNAKINEVKGEMHSITSLATTASLNAKINEVKGEIPSITNLAASAALTNVGKKVLMLVI